jgi:hypothetical protein
MCLLLAYPLWSLALISFDFCRPCPETPKSSSHGESCSEIGEAAREKNRAAAVALNADVRRTKARLMDAVKLQKIVAKKVKDRSYSSLIIKQFEQNFVRTNYLYQKTDEPIC